MNKLNITKKILSFVTCLALSSGIVTVYPAVTNRSEKASARTLQEVEEEREANQRKINELPSLNSMHSEATDLTKKHIRKLLLSR